MGELYCEHERAGAIQPEATAVARNPTPTSTATSNAITAYLVANEADGDRYRDLRLNQNEMVLIAGSAEENLRAKAILKDLELHLGAGRLTVVDLRSPVATAAGG